jgi:hypothetical protein
LPSIPFSVSPNGFGFSGCNDIFIPCEVKADKSFRISGQTSSTANVCPIDYDRQYLQVIAYADGYGIDNANFYLTKNGTRIIDFIRVLASEQVISLPQNTISPIATTTTQLH